jgi:hypothetical protein
MSKRGDVREGVGVLRQLMSPRSFRVEFQGPGEETSRLANYIHAVTHVFVGPEEELEATSLEEGALVRVRIEGRFRWKEISEGHAEGVEPKVSLVLPPPERIPVQTLHGKYVPRLGLFGRQLGYAFVLSDEDVPDVRYVRATRRRGIQVRWEPDAQASVGIKKIILVPANERPWRILAREGYLPFDWGFGWYTPNSGRVMCRESGAFTEEDLLPGMDETPVEVFMKILW